ncbi:hypothetical protein SHIRM173S_10732 [Streptomyces hirsutus]
MPVPVVQTPSGTWLVTEPAPQAAGRVVAYCRVSSGDRKADLERQVARTVQGATDRGLAVADVVTEVGSGLNGRRRKLHRLLADPGVGTIVVEHQGDRLARFGVEHLEAAFSATGRRLVVLDPAETADDLVRDITEVLTSMCARLYGRRSAKNRAAQGRRRRHRPKGGRMKQFKPQPGFTVFAHKLALDPNTTANRHLHSHGGAARAAYNWAVAYITAVWWQRKAERVVRHCRGPAHRVAVVVAALAAQGVQRGQAHQPALRPLVGGELQGGVQHRPGRRGGSVRQLREVQERQAQGPRDGRPPLQVEAESTPDLSVHHRHDPYRA